VGRAGRAGRAGHRGQRAALALLVCAFASCLRDLPDLRGPRHLLAAQSPFDQTVRDLSSGDPGVRLRAVETLRDAANPDAALPLARLIADPRDAVQLAAIAAELNIFMAQRVVPRKRVGFVVEVRTPILAEPLFSAGPSAIGARRVPIEVLTALRAAWRDDNPRVGLEALYAFGALADDASEAGGRDLRSATGPDVAALVGASDPAMRFAAVRVIGRVYARRKGAAAVDAAVGDAVISAVNDNDRAVKIAAMRALGAMRDDRAVDSLTKLFEYYGKGEIAEAALDALARIAHPSSAPLFAAQLASKAPALRALAIDGLAREGDPAALDRIRAVADVDRDEAVALAGAFAAAMLGNGAIDRLVQAAANGTEQARQYLVELAPGRAERFARQAADPDTRIRLAIVEALAVSNDPEALKIVEALTRDPDPRVARAAEHAAARLRR